VGETAHGWTEKQPSPAIEAMSENGETDGRLVANPPSADRLLATIRCLLRPQATDGN
jgi:hypothetical protein